MPLFRIPSPLRQYVNDQSTVSVGGDTVGTALDELVETYPELRQHLFEDGRLRSFVNIYLNEEDIRFLNGEDTVVEEDDTLMIIPSIAGGHC